MYAAVLGLHSLLRGVVLLLAGWALFGSYSGWVRGRPWSGLDRQAGLVFSIVFDIQVLLGNPGFYRPTGSEHAGRNGRGDASPPLAFLPHRTHPFDVACPDPGSPRQPPRPQCSGRPDETPPGGGDVHPGHAGHRRRYPLVASASAGPWVKHGPGGRTVEGRQARMWTGGS